MEKYLAACWPVAVKVIPGIENLNRDHTNGCNLVPGLSFAP
jgi:hypothetical protein